MWYPELSPPSRIIFNTWMLYSKFGTSLKSRVNTNGKIEIISFCILGLRPEKAYYMLILLYCLEELEIIESVTFRLDHKCKYSKSKASSGCHYLNVSSMPLKCYHYGYCLSFKCLKYVLSLSL